MWVRLTARASFPVEPILGRGWYINKKAALAKGDYIYIVPRQVCFQKLSQHFC